jgi:4,5-DOPA dioxygenase extradiol
MVEPSSLMPAIFFGHGSPMNAIERNRHTQAWAVIGHSIGKPRAVLAISAHWYEDGTLATAMERPPTIHDFGGFPPALHALDYPAPGDPALAAELRSLLAPEPVGLDRGWGLDHGTWSVLVHVFPKADVPVVQLSIDRRKPPAALFDLARKLEPLRATGVLIAGFGNVVHNLRAMQREPDAPPYDWAVRFNAAVRGFIETGAQQAIIDYAALGRDAAMAVPTQEHYLPLLYVMAQQRPGEAARILTDGIEMGSISMLSAAIGLDAVAG